MTLSPLSFRCSLILALMLSLACGSVCRGDETATTPTTEPAKVAHKWFDPSRTWMLVMCSALCGSVLVCIGLAQSGRPMWVRKIAALQAVDEAVGRATEMGRPCLFIPGIQDMDNMGTIAGVSVLGESSQDRVAEWRRPRRCRLIARWS